MAEYARRCQVHPSGYQAGCYVCQRRSRWYNSRLRRDRATGTWEPMVPIAKVRARIRALQAEGLSNKDIAALAGTSVSQLYNLLYRKTTKQVTPVLAHAILGCPVKQVVPPRFDDGPGTSRRLRALSALGWSFEILADRLGVDRSLPQQWSKAPRVSTRTAETIRALYEELKDTPGPSGSSRKRAATRGWPTPAAWIDIDNPDEDPNAEPDDQYVDEVAVQRVISGHARISSLANEAERVAVVAVLARQEHPDGRPWGASTIAYRLGTSKNVAARLLRIAKEQADGQRAA